MTEIQTWFETLENKVASKEKSKNEIVNDILNFTNKSLNKFEIPGDYLHLPWKDYKN